MENYTVTVTGHWTDPRTKLASARTETYRVAARRPADAQIAGTQLFTADAARRRFLRTGDCRAEAVVAAALADGL